MTAPTFPTPFDDQTVLKDILRREPARPARTLDDFNWIAGQLNEEQRRTYVDDVLLEATSGGRYHVDDAGRPHLLLTPDELVLLQAKGPLPPRPDGLDYGLLGVPVYVGECPCVAAERTFAPDPPPPDELRFEGGWLRWLEDLVLQDGWHVALGICGILFAVTFVAFLGVRLVMVLR